MICTIGILVCQSQEVLQHKLNDGKKEDRNYCFWRMKRFPRRIRRALGIMMEGTGRYSISARAPSAFDGYYDEDDIIFEEFTVRLFFAVKGVVRGYFICKACDKDETELRFHSEDWFPLEDRQLKIKPSQGWRYFDIEVDVKDE